MDSRTSKYIGWGMQLGSFSVGLLSFHNSVSQMHRKHRMYVVVWQYTEKNLLENQHLRSDCKQFCTLQKIDLEKLTEKIEIQSRRSFQLLNDPKNEQESNRYIKKIMKEKTLTTNLKGQLIVCAFCLPPTFSPPHAGTATEAKVLRTSESSSRQSPSCRGKETTS